jgi:hypothetical protein
MFVTSFLYNFPQKQHAAFAVFSVYPLRASRHKVKVWFVGGGYTRGWILFMYNIYFIYCI